MSMPRFAIDATVSGSFLSPQKVEEALHGNSAVLALEEAQRVRERTPVLTGALRSAVNYTNYTNPRSRQLVKVWYEDEPQLFTWKRVYAAYQEGPPLGLSTYTNAPHQMLYGAETEDAGAIQQWADETLAQAEAEAEAETFADSLENFIATYFAGGWESGA
jgi:hypothetical protein